MATACLPVTGALTVSASTPPEPRSYKPETATPRPTERISILKHPDSSSSSSEAPGDSSATQALPAGWADEQAATSVMPAGSDQWAQADEWADSQPTTAVPSYAPEPTVQAPAATAQWSGPAVQPQPQPAPQPQPEVLPPNRSVRQRTAALPIGTFLLVASVVLLGWGVYTLLVSLHVFDVVLNNAALINWPAAIAVGVGALLAFFAFIAALVACSRARPKTAAIMLLLGTLVLPLASTAAGAYYGGSQLKDQTLADASQWKGKIDVSQLKDLKSLIDQVENVGIDVSWRDDLLRTLGVSDGTSGDSTPGSNSGDAGTGSDSDGSGSGGYGSEGDDSGNGGNGYDDGGYDNGGNNDGADEDGNSD